MHLLLELVAYLFNRWYEGNVDTGCRNQIQGHLTRGRKLLKEGLYRQAETEFNSVLYYHLEKSDLLLAENELRQASLEDPGNVIIRNCYEGVSLALQS